LSGFKSEDLRYGHAEAFAVMDLFVVYVFARVEAKALLIAVCLQVNRIDADISSLE
jgi:hypothetical protein